MPREVAALRHEGLSQLKAGAYADALESFQRLVRATPTSAPARYHLAVAAFALGETHRATTQLRRTLRRRRHVPSLEFLATIAPFDSRLSHRAVLKYRQALYAALRKQSDRLTVRPVSAGRVLKVGYVSSYFQNENWMKSVWALIDHHDRRTIEVHLFSDAPESAVAHLARRSGYRFHDISRRDNAQTARTIARNRIDVLVDLNGFSRRSRLALYAMKPAPIMIGWFNVLGTSGMPTFDAVVGDEWVVEKTEERWYSEPIIRLPMSNQTFAVTYPVPDVQPPPCLKNGFITFGSLAPMYKLNPSTLDTWADILERCPTTQLLLANSELDDSGNRAYLVKRFAARGIGTDRLILRGGATHREFLRNYDAIDLALDTLVYGGGTSTIESLWQGVPVLTCRGDRWTARQATSILSNAGLERFVQPDVDGYIAAAVEWGSAPSARATLRPLRRTMRARLRASSVCDCTRFARCMEALYRRLQQSAFNDSAGFHLRESKFSANK